MREVYVCEECNFVYTEKEKARECEGFCKKHRSCSTEITKKSIGELKLEGN